MANIWELFYTFAPASSCAGLPAGTPLYDQNWQYFKVNGGPMQTFGQQSSICPDTEASVRDPIINYLKSGQGAAFGYPLMTDADTVYTNGILYYSPSPTHVISLSMGFLPQELVSYFAANISGISKLLMTKMAPPPSPWEYLYTTFDSAANAFNIWLWIPSTAVLTMVSDDKGFEQHANPGGELKTRYSFMTMSPGALQDLYDWIMAWAALITGVILVIIALFVPMAGWLAVVPLFTGVALLAWRVYDAVTKQQLAETKATNLGIQLDQENKATQANNTIETAWNSSAKTTGDCLTRLQGHMQVQVSKLNGYLTLYAKYADLVKELNTELTDFTSKANDIITALKSAAYTTSACDTYYVQLNDLAGASDVAINNSLSKYIIPDQNYSIACKGWKDQASCEHSGCYWYDGACHQDEKCWISNPLGGCILSAKSGTAIIGATAAIFLTGFAYWLFTRHGEEAKTIYIGAKEAALGEVERTKTAYRQIAAGG